MRRYWIKAFVSLFTAILFLNICAFAYVPVIDAGHGGEDGGAVSDSGVVESALNLEVAKMVKLLFCLFGDDPVMIRESDLSLHSSGANTIREKKVSDLKNRVARINSIDNALLISIHQNTYTDSRYSGAHIFFTSDICKPYAELLQKRIKALLDPSNIREAKKAPSSVYLLSHVKCPAILVECGFMTNHRELKLLMDSSYQKRLASLIVSGYYDFIAKK